MASAARWWRNRGSADAPAAGGSFALLGGAPHGPGSGGFTPARWRLPAGQGDRVMREAASGHTSQALRAVAAAPGTSTCARG